MAGRGPAPKGTLSRERDQARRDALTLTVSVDGTVRGPDLPDVADWPSQTLAWWETWRRSPQSSTFTDTDWDFLIDTALLHADYWTGNLAVAGELRLRAAKFGATPEDRQRLRLEVTGPDDKPAARPRSAARRASLLKAVESS